MHFIQSAVHHLLRLLDQCHVGVVGIFDHNPLDLRIQSPEHDDRDQQYHKIGHEQCNEHGHSIGTFIFALVVVNFLIPSFLPIL